MGKVLFINSNPRTAENSFGLAVGEHFINQYKKQNPEDSLVRLDLYDMDIPLLDREVLSGWDALRSGKAFDELTASQQEKIIKVNELADQFVEADTYVFVSPLWNLSIPPMLKAYIDTFFQAGKSFRYTANGPEGLLKGKKAVHIQARGGVYSSGPAVEMEFGDRYLRAVMSFLGVDWYRGVYVEGMAYQPAEAEAIKQAALKNAEEVVLELAAQKVRG